MMPRLHEQKIRSVLTVFIGEWDLSPTVSLFSISVYFKKKASPHLSKHHFIFSLQHDKSSQRASVKLFYWSDKNCVFKDIKRMWEYMCVCSVNIKVLQIYLFYEIKETFSSWHYWEHNGLLVSLHILLKIKMLTRFFTAMPWKHLFRTFS